MEPISSGFLEGRQLSETKMNQACQEVLQGATNERLKEVSSWQNFSLETSPDVNMTGIL